MSRTRVLLICLLASCAISAATAQQASSFVTVSCVQFSIRWGGFSGSSCTSTVSGGFFAVMYFPTYTKRSICLWLGLGFGLFSDGFCLFALVGGEYMIFDPETKDTVHGGEYKFKTGTTEVSCSEMNMKNPEVDGGKDEEGEKEDSHTKAESLEFSGCKVPKPESCEVSSKAGAGKISTVAVVSELVENKESQLESLFKPETGETFAELEFKGSGCVLKSGALAGSMLMGIGPQKEESEKETLKSEPEKKEYKVGEKSGTAGLKFAGVAVTMTGETKESMKLDSFEIKETEDKELKGAKVPEESIDFENEE